MELGKPHELPIIWVGTPQGATMVQGVAETVKSEGQLVMSCIEVQNLPQPEKVQTYQQFPVYYFVFIQAIWNNTVVRR